MRAWVVALLVGCSGPAATVDGVRVPSLRQAAARAGQGSVITLEPWDHRGEVELFDGVILRGDQARVLGDGPLLVGLGALTVEGIELVGGGPDEGGLLDVQGDLTLQDVVALHPRAEAAIRPRGSVSVRGGRLVGERALIRTGNPIGRPRLAELLDLYIAGPVQIPADQIDVQGIEGALDLSASGHALLVQDAALTALDLRGPVLNLADVAVDGPVRLVGQTAQVLEVDGGTWTLDLDELTAVGWSPIAAAGQVQRTVLAEVDSSLLVLRGQSAALSQVRATELDLRVSSLTADHVSGLRLALFGLGTAHRVVADGPGASLVLGPVLARSAVVRSTQGPARVRLHNTEVLGMVVVEPPGTVSAEPVLEVQPSAWIEHLTWLGGARPRLIPAGSRATVGNSVLAGTDLGLPGEVALLGTVLWHLDGGLGPVPTAIVDDPRFVGPGDPRLAPDSPHLARGGFAGATGAEVGAMWADLP